MGYLSSSWLFPTVIVVVIVALVLNSRRLARLRREELEILRRDAMARGWEVAPFGPAGDSYSGTTNGIRWTFTTAAGGRARARARARIRTLWTTSEVRLSDGCILFLPSHGKQSVPTASNAPQFLVSLAATGLATSLGGDGSDVPSITAAQRITIEDAALAEAWFFNATDAKRLRSFLEAGAGALLQEATSWVADRKAAPCLVAGAVWRRGFTLSFAYPTYEFATIERIAVLGARLAASARSV